MSRVSKKLHNHSKAYRTAMLWEFKLIFRDKAVLVSFIGIAIIVSFLYTYVYSKEVIRDLPIGVVDNDNTTHSRQLLRMIDGASQTKISEHYTDLTKAKLAFEQDKIRGIVIIPTHFSKKIQRNEQPIVSVYADGAYMLYYKQVVTSVKICVGYMNAGIQIKKKSAQGNFPKQARDRVMAVSGKTVSLYNPSSGYAIFLIPIVLLVIFQTTMLSSIGILGGTMREGSKMHKLYPHADELFGTLPIVLGKATTYLFISIPILMILLGIMFPMFKIPIRSSFMSIIVYLIPFFLATVYLGIFLNTFFKRREDAILFIMFTSMPALMISGFSYPTQMMPEWIQVFSYFVPSTLGSKGFVSMSQMGAEFSLMKSNWLMLWGLCIFYFLLAVLSSKRIFLKERRHRDGKIKNKISIS